MPQSRCQSCVGIDKPRARPYELRSEGVYHSMAPATQPEYKYLPTCSCAKVEQSLGGGGRQ